MTPEGPPAPMCVRLPAPSLQGLAWEASGVRVAPAPRDPVTCSGSWLKNREFRAFPAPFPLFPENQFDEGN